MSPSGRLTMVSCAIALSGCVALSSASAQVSFDGGGTLFVPGGDGVLRLYDEPVQPRRARVRNLPRDYAGYDDEISPRYLNGLSRKAHRRSRPAEVRRIADAAPPSPVTPSDDVTRSIGDSDKLREQVARLSRETASLRSDIATLRTEFSKREGVSQDRLSQGQPEPPANDKTTEKPVEAPRTDELGPIRQDAARLKDETSRLRNEGETLRGQVSKLTAETASLKTGIAALKDELAKRPLGPATAENPAPDELPKVREEAARLKDETARLRAQSDSQRDQIAKLSTETGALRGDIAALKDELARRPVVPPAVSGKLDETLKKQDGPLRKEDALNKGGRENKTDSKADNKFAERPPLSKDEQRTKGDPEARQDAGFADKVWRRLLEMLGRSPKELP